MLVELDFQHYDVPFQPLGYCRSWFDRILFVVHVVWKFSSEIYLQSAVEELKLHSTDLSFVFREKHFGFVFSLYLMGVTSETLIYGSHAWCFS